MVNLCLIIKMIVILMILVINIYKFKNIYIYLKYIILFFLYNVEESCPADLEWEVKMNNV